MSTIRFQSLQLRIKQYDTRAYRGIYVASHVNSVSVEISVPMFHFGLWSDIHSRVTYISSNQESHIRKMLNNNHSYLRLSFYGTIWRKQPATRRSELAASSWEGDDTQWIPNEYKTVICNANKTLYYLRMPFEESKLFQRRFQDMMQKLMISWKKISRSRTSVKHWAKI